MRQCSLFFSCTGEPCHLSLDLWGSQSPQPVYSAPSGMRHVSFSIITIMTIHWIFSMNRGALWWGTYLWSSAQPHEIISITSRPHFADEKNKVHSSVGSPWHMFPFPQTFASQEWPLGHLDLPTAPDLRTVVLNLAHFLPHGVFFPGVLVAAHVMGLCWVSSPPTQPYIYGCLYMCESQIWLESKTLLFMSPSILWQLSWNKGTYRMMSLNSTDHNVCVSTCVCVFKVRSQNVNSHEWSQSVRPLVEKHLLFLFTSFAISNI